MAKILFAIYFLKAVFAQQQNATYKYIGSEDRAASIFGKDVIMREVTSLRGTGSGLLACAFACTELGGCRAFVREHERCILLGDATLPGEDVAAASLTEGKAYKIRGITECVLS